MLSFLFAERGAQTQDVIRDLETVRARITPNTATTLGHLVGSVNFLDLSLHNNYGHENSRALVRRIFNFAVAPEKRVALYTDHHQEAAADLAPYGRLHMKYPHMYEVMVYIDRRDIIKAAIDICSQPGNLSQARQLRNILGRTMRNESEVTPEGNLVKAYFPGERPIQPLLDGLDLI